MESVHEQIAAALQASLEGVLSDGGTTYWYTPDSVRRVAFFPDATALDTSMDVIYLLRPGVEDITEEGTGGACQGQAEFFLVVAKQHNVPTENPWLETEPTRWTVANRLIRDALRKLLADPTIGGAAINVVADSISVDRDRFLQNWALAEIRFAVVYAFQAATP
jgi:hypothetical protein